MTKTIEIVEGNKLIAEFMGAIWKKDIRTDSASYDYWGYYFELKNTPTESSSCWWSADAMLYHSSWDWLMPVVEKIDGIAKRHKKSTSVHGCKITDPIEKVWNAVVQFLLWYENFKIVQTIKQND